ncbi:MAG: hypothetical protein OEL81_03180 [Nitrosopumilus sp.]|nr:hypothetical protein [Nitrosopumilus sp.]MDH3488258.1 hypothetical protein [Nitrosopumilus sp.]
MNRKSAWIVGVAVIFAISMIAASSSFTEVSGEPTQKPSAPRYSETCAHGHNGFDCKPSQYRMDISELQQRTVELENRISQLERR